MARPVLKEWKSGFNILPLLSFDSMDLHSPCMNSCRFLASTIFCIEDILNEEIVYRLPSSLVGCYSVLKICISQAFTL